MKKHILQNICLAPFGLFLRIVALLPLRILYILSDLLYPLVYYIGRYRLHIVRKNLKNAFPQNTPQERKAIERRFYRHFCDYFFETIKLLHISDDEMRRRMQFVNAELLESTLNSGRSVIMMLGHYGNWEWFSGSTSRFKDSRIYQIYRPLNNQAFDRLFFNLRTKFGSFGIKKQDTVRDVITLKKDKTRCVVIFIADQTPSRNNLHYWTNFLNQDSSILTGPERLARKLDLPVIFLDTKQVKRGYYTIDMKLVTETPKETPENWITEQYARLMEKCILRNPSGWLWTHKRWKHKRVES